MKRLLLEGGGQRSVFTAGVLDFFMDKGITFDEVYGVSAGAMTATSYLSNDRGRAIEQMERFTGDKRYISLKNRVTKGSFFGWEYIFEEIPKKLLPMNFEAFRKNPATLYAGAYECETGKTVYFPLRDPEDKEDLKRLQASASLPYYSPFVEINGKHYADGGIADPFALAAFKDDGAKTVIVLTQDRSYIKGKKRSSGMKYVYGKYPHLVHDSAMRSERYNADRRIIFHLEEEGKIFVIIPRNPLKVSIKDTDKNKLKEVYEEGYRAAEERYEALKEYLKEGE